MQSEKRSRMDTSELKAQLLKKVGPDRFKKYFFCLNRFINQKVSKSEFDKSCYRLLGRENLSLHNQIIRAILKNACSAKVPPPLPHEVGSTSKAGNAAGKRSPTLEDGSGQGVVLAQNQNSVPPVRSNGVVPVSPRKERSAIRDRKIRERSSPLGTNEKADSGSYQSTATDDGGAKISENGDLGRCDHQRLLQQRGLAEQPENGEGLAFKRPGEVSVFVRGKDQNNVAVVEDEDEVEQVSRSKFSRSHLRAPLGISFGSASTGVAHKALPITHVGDYVGCFDIAGLYGGETLRRRMELIAAAQGLGGVTMECTNTLNMMVDVYLKRLIRPGLELVGSRSTSGMSTYPVQKQQMHSKLNNGLLPRDHLHVHRAGAGGGVEEQRFHHPVSMLDFKVAMELNPQQLGENWPLLMERICMQAYEE